MVFGFMDFDLLCTLELEYYEYCEKCELESVEPLSPEDWYNNLGEM